MATHLLDNPIWWSLASRHRSIALSAGAMVRYPPDHAPFVAVGQEGVDATSAIATLLGPGETLLLLGPVPRVSDCCRLERLALLSQMICPTPIDPVDGPEPLELTDAHRADVLALTALVYPHYFRSRTMELGRYFGIYRDGRLAAMIGERLGTDDHQEISAVCTHPDHAGHGYARQLLAWLSNDTLARGRVPFLHVSRDNHRAIDLYARNGYRLRAEIPLWSLGPIAAAIEPRR